MPTPEIAYHRLHNEYLSRPTLGSAAEVVGWLTAVQSQDYYGALWAISQRTSGLTEAELDRAFNAGEIIRTHVMRPTWHFVTPQDLRWMLMLTAPRVHQISAFYYRQVGLDAAEAARCMDVIVKALEGGNHLTRAELAAALEAAGIDTKRNLRLPYIMMYAELEAIICSGSRNGKQQTYALVDEWVAPAPEKTHDEALAEMTLRYMTSHGPATVHDFSWWSGLTVTECKRGVEMVKASLESIEAEGKTYWFAPSTAPVIRDESPKVFLLPNYDEYTVSYKDRSAIVTAEDAAKFDVPEYSVLAHSIVVDSQVIGTWGRTLKKQEVIVNPKPFRPLSSADEDALADAVQRYGDFLQLKPVMSIVA